jgi:glycine/D-amino acid oxidase-like deaminating enzyme
LKGFLMSSSHSGQRVAVVGGGILGTASALELARRGADVTLVTSGRLADGASGRSLSWLNSFGADRSAEYHRLRLAGIERYRAFAERVPAQHYLRFDGGLTWAPAGPAEGHRRHLRHMQQIGYPARWVSRDEIPVVAAGVDPAAVPAAGAIFNPSEGWVDLEYLVAELARQFTAAGGTLRTDAGRAQVRLAGGRAAGVVTGSGERIDADAVLLATGADVPATAAEFGARIPDATSLALLVRTRPLQTPLRATLNTPSVSLRPAPDSTLVMDSDAAAQEVIAHADGSYEVKDATVQNLMDAASAVLAGHPELALDHYGVGRKPIPGDGEPVLGELDEVPGLFVAFTHSGATVGLISGELLAEEITSGTPSALLERFRPGRFAGEPALTGSR